MTLHQSQRPRGSGASGSNAKQTVELCYMLQEIVQTEPTGTCWGDGGIAKYV